MDEISDEISINIYEKIYKVKDKHNMIQVNKYFNNLFQDDFNKYYVKKLLNTDYLEFYKYLNKYDYEMDFLNKLLINATEDIHTVWSQNVTKRCIWSQNVSRYESYDLRYIFELMYKGCILKDNIETMYQGSIIKVNITSYMVNKHINNNTRNFYKNFYKHILQSIVYNDRQATLFNIEHSSVMISALKQSYNYYKKGEYENKPYIKLVSS
jgi:transcriptional regulator with PAS, ATPase and Fis domain